MANSDFAWVNFDSDFTAANPVETRNFTVEGDPIGTGYLLVQARSLDAIGSETQHQIEINGQDLPSFDLPTHEGNNRWTTWMDRIPPNFLDPGNNRITIRRVDPAGPPPGDFHVANVAIHWREN